MGDLEESNREKKNKVYYVPVMSENDNILAYKKVDMNDDVKEKEEV